MNASTAASRPLDDNEIVELDELLAAIPEEREALDVAMLDGYLVGVLLQPEPVEPAAWLPLIFDANGDEQPEARYQPPQRLTELVMRRHGELAASLAAREPFDPIVFDFDDEDGAPSSPQDAIAALGPWAAGFMNALSEFPGLLERYGDDAEVSAALFGVLRHLPLDPDDPEGSNETFVRDRQQVDRDVPLANLDEAIDELVGCVLEAAEIVRPHKPVTRTSPKVGRNDPCPCGSGRKYKQCHGAAES
jgi:uncharacterized protein